MTQAAWVRLYEMGRLRDSWVFTARNTRAIVIVEIDTSEKQVFGYFQASEKQFFKVGYTDISKYRKNNISFTLDGKQYELSSFKRL